MADIDPGLVVDFLKSPCCQDPREREDSQKYDLQESPRDSSEPPCDLEVTVSIESGIWSQDTVVVISDERVHSGMLCLLNFNCTIARCLRAVLDGNGPFPGDSLGSGRCWNASPDVGL